MASTPSQLIQQATRHAAHLERLKSHETRLLRDTLRDIQDGLLGRLARNDVPSWTRARAERQLSAFAAMLDERYGRDIIPQLENQIRQLAEYEADFEVRSLGNVAPRHNFTLPTTDQIITAVRNNPLTMSGPGGGELLSVFMDGWKDNQIRRTVGAIRSGYVQGQTTGQIIGGLRDQFMPAQMRDMETVVRTSLQHAATQTRDATWQRNRDIIRRVRIVATLDARTSTICQSLDGQEYPLDSGPRPPFHPNCRTTVVAVLDDRFSALGRGATRSTRDPETGLVESAPAKQTYYGWLKTQPSEVQDSIIGETRGRLLRDGGLSAERFAELQLGKRFEPLNLNQMRELDPVAFIRAGL